MLSIDPKFEMRRAKLVSVAKCISFIGTKSCNGEFASATAFFIGPVTLLTAGHVVPDKSMTVIAQLPGKQQAYMDVEGLFEDNPPVEVLHCRHRYSMDCADGDLAVLEFIDQDFKATQWVELDRKKLKTDLGVDILGYPGAYGPEYVIRTHDEAVSANPTENRKVSELLPTCTLTVSHGPVLTGVPRPAYRLSTIAGMSGSPVIVDGKAAGTLRLALSHLQVFTMGAKTLKIVARRSRKTLSGISWRITA